MNYTLLTKSTPYSTQPGFTFEPVFPIVPSQNQLIPPPPGVSRIARSVGLVAIGGEDLGTCFLVGTNWVLTAKHVVPLAQMCPNVTVTFGLGAPPSGIHYAGTTFTLDDAQGSYIASVDGPLSPNPVDYHLDYALLRLRPGAVAAGLQFEYIRRTRPNVAKGTSITVVGYNQFVANLPLNRRQILTYSAPDGGVAPPTPFGNEVFEVRNGIVYHRATTTDGASGSPIITTAGELVGVHTHNTDPDTNSNWGTLIEKIVEDIRARGQLPDEIEGLRDPV